MSPEDSILPPVTGEVSESMPPLLTRVVDLLSACPGPSPREGPGKPILESTEKAMGWEGTSHMVFSGQRDWTGNLMFGPGSWGGAPS